MESFESFENEGIHEGLPSSSTVESEVALASGGQLFLKD
jgi:hypothetical protein